MRIDSNLPCFTNPDTVIDEIRDRISTRYNTGINPNIEYLELVERLVKNSMSNWRTHQYDLFQKLTNNIEK